MASLSESNLISKLESSTSTPVFPLFCDFLIPFNDIRNPKKNKSQVQTLTRSLAKQFLPFLNRCLSILPKRLSDSSKLRTEESNESPKLVTELFDVYELCLDCLELVSSQLSCKPYMVSIQRVRLLYCLEAFGFYKEAENEGFGVLEKLRGLDLGEKKKRKEKLGEFVPNVVENGDAEFAKLVVEVVVAIVKCVALRQGKAGWDYKKVIRLVDEVAPWFRVLDANAYEKLHRVLVTYLGKCTLFLLGELQNFDRDIVRAFSLTSLNEYAKSSLKDQIYKFSRRICSTLLLLQDYDRPSVIVDMLICIFNFLAHMRKVEEQNWRIEFVELVSYCANKCLTASTIFCSTFAEHLNKLAGDLCPAMTPTDMILRLYVVGLTYNDSVVKSQLANFTSFESAVNEPAVCILLSDGVTSHNLASVLGSLRSYFYDRYKENCVSYGVDHNESDCLLCSQKPSHYGITLACTQKDRRDYLLGYLNALEFLCQPLAELINSEKKQIVAKNEVASVSTFLFSIQEAFDQFFDVFLFFHSTASEKEGEEIDEKKTILSVAVAAFTLSIRTKLKFQRNVHLIKHIIASKWIQPRELKYIFASLYNLGVHLYRNKEVNEASKALKLSCRASWTCVVLLCQMSMNKTNGLTDDLSEDLILDFVMEACTRTAFLLDVLSQGGSPKVKKMMVYSLESWSVAEDLFTRLPGPMPLVKQWVKIECKWNKKLDVDDSPTLYDLLSSSPKLSKRTIGKILQQELLAYEGMGTIYPELCQQKQIKIIDILLQDIYFTQDCYLERSRILLQKGRALRASGFEGLTGCIQCVSEAISIINEKCCNRSPTCLQLAVAYCLRALCTQEAVPNSKQVLQDVKAALNVWLSIPVPDDGSILSDSAMPLLYNIFDLLSIKGSIEFHNDMYKLMIRLFEQKNVPLEKFLSMLWESRRLSHALCVSPVCDELLMSLSRDYGEQFKSIDFWMHCLKESPPLLIGFQLNFSYLFTSISWDSCNHRTSFQSDITVDDAKQAAYELISRVPVTCYSVFFAGCLLYDLCEKLLASGQLSEALYYAKEAHRLRTRLFQEKFTYSVEQETEKHIEAGDHTQKLAYGLSNLQVNKSAASELWYSDTISLDFEDSYISPWKILQCYLESTLQVGIVHEIIGNGGEAETFLLWGKNISCQQSLSLYIVAFSSVLGKLYRKKRSWDLSEKELQSAKQTLALNCSAFSCQKCRLVLEITIDQQLADLSRNRIFYAKDASMEWLHAAERLYKSSLDKLNFSVWKNSISCPEEVEDGMRNKFPCPSTDNPDTTDSVSTTSKPNAKVKTRRCRQTKNNASSLPKEQSSMSGCNTRLTRSRYRSSQNPNSSSSTEVLVLSKHINGNNECDLSDAVNQGKSLSQIRNSTVNFTGEVTCICNKLKCWFCLAVEVQQSGLFMNYIYMKWELIRRQLSLRVLSGRGKCLEIHGQIHEAHENILQSISVLFSRNPFNQTYAPASFSFLLDLVGREFSGDVFAIERAALLYNICWFSLKGYCSKDNRNICCDLSHVQLPKIVSCLMLAFVLCREVPILFQKVSRLLSGIYMLSSSSERFSLPPCKVLSEGHWASYFHQASLGTHLTCQFFSSITGKHKAANLVDDQGSQVTGLTCNLPRLAPKSVKDLEQFVTDFFSNLPCTTVICISLIGGPCATLLQDLLMYPSCACAWMLLSRLNFKSQPIVMLLPVGSISEEASDDDAALSGCGEFSENNDMGKHWHCPWGFTVIDEVAPAFKLILEENYLSSSIFPLEDTKENRNSWWMRRKKLDWQLGKLLRNLEDLWLGPWRFVLLGEFSNCKHLDSVQKKLIRNLRSKCKVDVNESFLKVILGGGRYALDGGDFFADLVYLEKSCFIGKTLYSDEETCQTLYNEPEGIEKLSDLAIQLLHDALNELEEDSLNREPIILVLDCDIQMLPWENLPVLRNQEVYRMPSVGSICLTLDRSCNHQEQVERKISAFPSIDPLDAFYLLNPSGDLNSTQVEFENWFKVQNLEGKAGSAPTAEELSSALKSHDLFLYFGHGSGAQYISQQEIQKLENCAATLLMGCSSGSLSLHGCYTPQGTPLSYLLAGSPIIVANLWEVTDKDIDRFGKAMLDGWLKERSNASTDCAQCNLLLKEFEALNLKNPKVTTKRKVQKKKELETCDSDSLKNFCNHRPRIGSFMSQAREACTLPFLIGASPVCYGVPTGIRKKNPL